MKLINNITTAYVKQRLNKLRYFSENPHETQQKVFISLIEKGKNTLWGNKYNFSSINDQKQFRQYVPVVDYDMIKPLIDRVMKGEKNVFWPGKIRWFAKSSGTTSDKSKYIPVTRENLEQCHYKGGRDLLSFYCHHNPDSKVFNGKCLLMGGSHQINELNNNSRYGDVSAVMMQNMPFYARFFQTPDMETALMDDWEEKLGKMAKETKDQNVTQLAGVPTWTIVLIRKLFEITGKTDLHAIWPNLELYIHGGVSFRPYRQQFNQLISPEGMHYYESYNASEGFFAAQCENDADDMLLLLDNGVYYEFIPESEMNKEEPETIGLKEVETGENYALVVSTNAGLWRYKIGDTIRFTSLDPFKVQVSGRIKHFINAFGEEVIVDNSDKAIEFASAGTDAIVNDYTAAPVYFSGESKGGHEWLIEFKKKPENLDEFIIQLDKHLQNINTDYAAKRFKDLALKLPEVKILKEGTFYEWMKSRGKLGGQNKVPRLSNDRKYVESILAFSGGPTART